MRWLVVVVSGIFRRPQVNRREFRVWAIVRHGHHVHVRLWQDGDETRPDVVGKAVNRELARVVALHISGACGSGPFARRWSRRASDPSGPVGCPYHLPPARPEPAPRAGLVPDDAVLPPPVRRAYVIPNRKHGQHDPDWTPPEAILRPRLRG